MNFVIETALRLRWVVLLLTLGILAMGVDGPLAKLAIEVLESSVNPAIASRRFPGISARSACRSVPCRTDPSAALT